ncbi:MAG: histidine kinase, partial [Corynebacterium durum]
MVIDRIIAGIVLILGGIHITLLYALAEQPPLNEPKPELWVAIVLGIIFILEAATTLRRRSQPITMLWICIALEAMRYVVLIVSEQAANSSSICIAALAYAAIRYTPAPYKQLAAQSAIYTITSAIAYIYMPMPMPMEGISAPLLLGTIGAATGLAMLVIGIIPGYIA